MKVKVARFVSVVTRLKPETVRALGMKLNIPEHLVWRHPSPGPSLAIRIIGAVTEEQLRIVRHADSIFLEEISAAGLYRSISQAFAVRVSQAHDTFNQAKRELRNIVSGLPCSP